MAWFDFWLSRCWMVNKIRLKQAFPVVNTDFSLFFFLIIETRRTYGIRVKGYIANPINMLKSFLNFRWIYMFSWCLTYVILYDFLYLSEVEILYIKDGEDSLCSAFYGALVPLILSVMCNVLWSIRWVYINRWIYYAIWCYELLFQNVHHLIEWSEIQLPADIVEDSPSSWRHLWSRRREFRLPGAWRAF